MPRFKLTFLRTGKKQGSIEIETRSLGYARNAAAGLMAGTSMSRDEHQRAFGDMVMQPLEGPEYQLIGLEEIAPPGGLPMTLVELIKTIEALRARVGELETKAAEANPDYTSMEEHGNCFACLHETLESDAPPCASCDHVEGFKPDARPEHDHWRPQDKE